MEQIMIDATSVGALLISNVAANSQQFNTQAELPVRKVNEVSTSSTFEQQIANLTSVVQQLAMGGSQQVLKCEICSMNGHLTHSCPTLYENGSYKQANVVGGF